MAYDDIGVLTPNPVSKILISWCDIFIFPKQ
jgi:hypothetical protein